MPGTTRRPIREWSDEWPQSRRPSNTSGVDVEQYKYGFVTDIESDFAPKGLNEDTVRFISAKKDEPEWMLEWRLEAYRRWLTMEEPTWARVQYPKIDYQDLYYYAAPKPKKPVTSLDEVDPELLKTYAKLGIPLREGDAGRRRAQARRARRGPALYRGGRGVRHRLGRDHLQGGAGQGRRDLLLDLRGDPRASGAGAANISARWCRRPTITTRR